MAYTLRLRASDVELLDALRRAPLDVTLIGGRAVVFYGMPRETFDTDFVLDLRIGARGATRLLDILAALGYVPYNPERAMDERSFLGATHAIFTKGDDVVDAWTRPKGWGIEMLGRRIKVRAGGFEAWVAHPDDILRMKLALARPKDREDIRFLKAVRRSAGGTPAPLATIDAELVIESSGGTTNGRRLRRVG